MICIGRMPASSAECPAPSTADGSAPATCSVVERHARPVVGVDLQDHAARRHRASALARLPQTGLVRLAAAILGADWAALAGKGHGLIQGEDAQSVVTEWLRER